MPEQSTPVDTVAPMPNSPFDDDRHLIVVDIATTGPHPDHDHILTIAALDMLTLQRWNITLDHTPAGDNPHLILALGDLADGLDNNTLGGFDPSTTARFLTRLLDDIDIDRPWYDTADIRQLTAGALGIPATATPSIDQTCNLWSATNPSVAFTAERAVNAAAHCFEALEHYTHLARTHSRPANGRR
jgi:hypothetical protein